MDREPEDLQFLGSVGIIREAFKILRSYAKLLGALTLTLILPLSLGILGHDFISEYLLHKIRWDEWRESRNPSGEQIKRQLRLEWTELIFFLTAYGLFFFALSLLSTAAAVYTVASIYTGKEVSYARVMSVVPRVWKRLMVTFFWFFLIVFAYSTAAISVFFLLIFAFEVNILQWEVFNVCRILTTVVFFSIHVYVSMVWHLACVISVLEEKYGRGAMRKSKELIKGKWITALTLDILYIILGGIIGMYFHHHVYYGRYYGAGIAERGAYGALSVGLLCFLNLMGLLIQSVFYFVSKSYHHESVDKSSLSDHLEVYLGDYVPLKGSNIQLEDLHASV